MPSFHSTEHTRPAVARPPQQVTDAVLAALVPDAAGGDVCLMLVRRTSRTDQHLPRIDYGRSQGTDTARVAPPLDETLRRCSR